jgi:hypothetical protein
VTPPAAVEPAVKPEARPETPATEPAPVATSEPGRADLHPGRTKKIAGLVVGAVGIAAIATGIAFGVLAKNESDALSALDQNKGTFDASHESAGHTDQILEGVMLGIGGAAVAAGVVVFALGHKESRAARSLSRALVPLVGRGQAGAALRLSF